MVADRDWFAIGERVCREGLRDADSFPPLNDMEAQRAWLGGFGAAWACRPRRGGVGR